MDGAGQDLHKLFRLISVKRQIDTIKNIGMMVNIHGLPYQIFKREQQLIPQKKK